MAYHESSKGGGNQKHFVAYIGYKYAVFDIKLAYNHQFFRCLVALTKNFIWGPVRADLLLGRAP